MTTFGSTPAGSSSTGAADVDPFVAAAQTEPVEQSPLHALVRALRGRWRHVAIGAIVMGPVLGTLGYLSGTQLFESQAIVRVFPQEANVLYRTGDDSVLKTFDSYVKAETSYLASPPVMERATISLAASFPELAADMTPRDLGGSIEIKRVDSLITMTTKSRDATFAAQKLQAVADAYLALHAETEEENSAVRLAELQARERQLDARQSKNEAQMLEVGGEYGVGSLAKAHADKIARIEELSSRVDEIEGTLASMKAKDGNSSADTANADILRSTLLDRALADLNFEHAKLEAELATMMARYPADSPQVQDKKNEIAVIDQAMADRREQIKVLGQTGALTDTTSANSEASLAEIQALLAKVTSQLESARADARDLNSRLIQLGSLQTEQENIAKLLEDTRQGIEVITVEAGQALPGYSVLMSPPVIADKPASDNSKVRMAAGLAAGLFLSLFAGLFLGLVSRKVRYSDVLKRYSHLVPVKTVARSGRKEKANIDRLRNALQLHPLRMPLQAEGARVIALTRLDSGAPDELALSLARSFADAHSRVLLVDADARDGKLTGKLGKNDAPGWREALEGKSYSAFVDQDFPNLQILPVGHASGIADTKIGVTRVRAVLAELRPNFDLVVLLCGSLADSISAELLLSVADLALAEVQPRDRKAAVAAHIAKLDSLPRQGGVLAFTHSRANDPGLFS